MIDDNNPYRSPETYAQVESETASTDALVRRGRAIYLGIAVFVLFCELLPSVTSADGPHPFRLLLTLGLLFAVWQGRGWAVVVLTILLAIGAIFGLVLLAAIGSRSALAVAVLAPIILGYAAIPFLLMRARSVNAFFQHQQCRVRGATDAMRIDNWRNVVELTSAAAELTRARISDRDFPPETALRVVRGGDGNSRLDIQYDLPSEGDRDWVGESQGIVVLVDKSIAGQLEGLVIDAQHGEYVFQMPTGGQRPSTSASTPPTA